MFIPLAGSKMVKNAHPAVVAPRYSTTWRCAVKAALTNGTQLD
jgi:hypothetical protein